MHQEEGAARPWMRAVLLLSWSASKVEKLYEGTVPDPDITIISDPDTVTKLFNGEMKIMKAWALKKVKVKGSIDDVLRLRKFF